MLNEAQKHEALKRWDHYDNEGLVHAPSRSYMFTVRDSNFFVEEVVAFAYAVEDVAKGVMTIHSIHEVDGVIIAVISGHPSHVREALNEPYHPDYGTAWVEGKTTKAYFRE